MPKYSSEVIEAVNKTNIVDYVGQYVQLENRGGLFVGLCPFHDENTPSFTIYPETNSWYCWGCNKGSTLIDFVKFKYHCTFIKAIEYLLNYSHINPDEVQTKPPIIEYLKYYKKNGKKINKSDHALLKSNVMDQYEHKLMQEWVSEGISPDVLERYQVRYDSKCNRIVFPVFDSVGNIISVKGRTLYPNYKLLGIRKYTYYQKIGDLDFLYGLHFHKADILLQNECICVESEKSVMKLESLGILNSIAICTHNISPQQISELLQLKTKIVIAFDKDVKLNEIKEICKPLIRLTTVEVVYDQEGVLGERDAPCDRGGETWRRLYERRFRIY